MLFIVVVVSQRGMSVSFTSSEFTLFFGVGDFITPFNGFSLFPIHNHVLLIYRVVSNVVFFLLCMLQESTADTVSEGVMPVVMNVNPNVIRSTSLLDLPIVKGPGCKDAVFDVLSKIVGILFTAYEQWTIDALNVAIDTELTVPAPIALTGVAFRGRMGFPYNVRTCGGLLRLMNMLNQGMAFPDHFGGDVVMRREVGWDVAVDQGLVYLESGLTEDLTGLTGDLADVRFRILTHAPITGLPSIHHFTSFTLRSLTEWAGYVTMERALLVGNEGVMLHDVMPLTHWSEVDARSMWYALLETMLLNELERRVTAYYLTFPDTFKE
jgi:hypothetical protein